MPRPKPPEPVVDESKRWLDSYADAVTLLMAFFVMLFAFSLVDKEKYIDFKFGVAEALGKPNPTIEGGIGLLERGNGVAELVTAPPVVTEHGDGAEGFEGADRVLSDATEIATQAQAEALEAELEESLSEINALAHVEVTRDGRGVVLTFDEAVLFPSGKATINADGQIVLAAVGAVLRPFDNQVTVEGHTDTVPTNGTRWPTNWELGAARAVNVARFFSEFAGIPGARLQAITYGEFRPRDSNQTAEGRSRNRRVEVVVVVEDLEVDPDLTTGLFGIRPVEDPASSSG